MNDDFKEELKDCYAEIERLREANEMMLTDIRRTDVDMLAFKAEIERLRAALREADKGLAAGISQYAARTIHGQIVAGDEQYPWIRLMQIGMEATRSALAQEKPND